MSKENGLLPIPVTVTAETVQRVHPPVKPITIEKNGVYDATQGDLKYGETVTLKRNIPESEYTAFMEQFKSLGDFEAYVAYRFFVVQFEGLAYISAVLGSIMAIYIPTIEFANIVELPPTTVGEWVSDEDLTVVPPELLMFTLPTKEEYESETWLVEFEKMQSFFNESIFNKTQLGGYNPVTVNVPVPDGYHTSDDATATASDIIEGKTAYVNGEKLTGTHPIATTAIYPEDIRFGFTAVANGKKIEGTTLVPSGKMLFTVAPQETIIVTIPSYIYTQVDGGEIVGGYTFSLDSKDIYDEEGTIVGSEAQDHEVIVYNSYLERVTEWKFLASMSLGSSTTASSRLRVEDMDIRGMTSLQEAFYHQSLLEISLQSLSFKHTEKVRNIYRTFYQQYDLVSVKGLDMRNVSGNASGTFYYCKKLAELELKNIATSITVGSGSNYGHLLPAENLVGLLRELRQTNLTKTLTIGTTNRGKLDEYYPSSEAYPRYDPLRVKLIEVTDEMRAADDLIDEKLPFEICTREEAFNREGMLYSDYLALKNWKVQ